MSQSHLFETPLEPNVRCVSVLIATVIDKPYDYALPEGMELVAGDYVRVPLGSREVIGVVWGAAENTVNTAKIKNVIAKYDLPPMPEAQRAFIDWMAGYVMAPRGAVLKMALYEGGVDKGKGVVGYRLMAPSPSPPSAALPSPLWGEGDRALARSGEGAYKYKEKTSKKFIKRARELRRNQTDVEKKLWYRLNKNQFAVKFRRQHPIGNYIVDFICPEKMLIIELDGGQHNEDQKEYDEKRDMFFESQGYRVLRFWNNEVNENLEGVLNVILTEIEARPSWPPRKFLPPHPNPPPIGGRESCEARRAKQDGWGGEKYKKILNFLSDQKTHRASEITKATGVSGATLKTMVKKGLIEAVEIHAVPPCRAPDANKKGEELSADQSTAAEKLKSLINENKYNATLLDGVTGSGKTEVYFEAVAEALKNNKQILILVPEIALTNAFLDRFEKRFGCAPALWHSDITPAQRKITWRGVAQNECRVIVGARSALMLPYADLGLIIVDEEHDPAYKQEEGLIYNARDMAVARAHGLKIPIVLVSATPSIETIHNAWNGRYHHVHLPDRYGGARLPDVRVIDMRADRPERQKFIAPTLKKAIAETLESGEQTLLFLNRRGYAPLTLCRHCGHRMECPRCSAWMIEHKSKDNLQCHHCGFHRKIPKACPACAHEGSFAACGPGVERIFEEIKIEFPDAHAVIMASDTADTPEKMREMLNDIRERRIDIIVGTQIIAKGHHFPGLTCVGVIDADLGLDGAELRAAERTYQLLHQVAGRAGREELKGTAWLQTYNPENKVIKAMAAGDRDTFLEIEAQERERAKMPPYSRLAGIILSGRDEQLVKTVAGELGKTAPRGPGFDVFGPAPAPFLKLRGRYRYRLLARAEKSVNLQKTVKQWIKDHKIPSSIKLAIDIDPQSFF